MFKRGNTLTDLNLSGPHTKATFRQADDIVERLYARNAWAHCVNMIYPELNPILQPERCTWFVFSKYRRDFILEYDNADGLWELNGLCEETKPTPGGRNAPPPTEGGDGAGSSGPEPEALALPGKTRRRNGLPRVAARSRAALREIVCRTRGAARAVLETPRLRHTVSKIGDTLAWVRHIASHQLNYAKAQLHGAPAQLERAYGRLRILFSERDQLADEPFNGGRLERRVFEIAPGLSLSLCTWVREPNWESWLFGRPIEEEQLAA